MEMEEIKWSPLYKVNSARFTLSPKLFLSWVYYLLFSKFEEIKQFDLDSDLVNSVANEMQKQMKKGEKHETIKN